MRDQEHNYEIKSLPLGFEIVPKDETRPTVKSTVDEQGFWRFDKVQPWDEPYSLYNFYNLVNIGTSYLYDSWISPKTGTKDAPLKVKMWMRTQTSKCLNHKIHDEWLRVVNNFDPSKRDLHRRMFSLAVGKGNWDNIKTVLTENDSYLISDVMSYKSAAASVLFDGRLRWKDDWAFSYAKNDVKYHSLMRTLMNLPNGIVYGMLPNLSEIHLPEPAFTRIRLLAYLNIPPSYSNGEKANILTKVIQRSTDDDIRNAVKLIWHYFPSKKISSFKSAQEIMRAFLLIFDYDGIIGDWDMLGLARRSEVYHHNMEVQRRIQQEAFDRQNAEWKIKEEEKVAKLMIANTQLPVVPLPKDEHVKFLSSYKSVLDEGDLMHHCIAQYAERAVRGNSYLFHVDYNGETASVEVDPSGFVRQSYGPKDCSNNASEYGRKILNVWAKSLQDKFKKDGVIPLNTEYDNYGVNPNTPF